MKTHRTLLLGEIKKKAQIRRRRRNRINNLNKNTQKTLLFFFENKPNLFKWKIISLSNRRTHVTFTI